MMCPSMSGMCMAGGASKVPLLLLALAAGYGVLVLSTSQQRPLDVLGRLLGGIILVVSFVGLLCVATSRMCQKWGCDKGMGMACSSAKMHCPMSDAGAPAEQPTPTESTPQKK